MEIKAQAVPTQLKSLFYIKNKWLNYIPPTKPINITAGKSRDAPFLGINTAFLLHIGDN